MKRTHQLIHAGLVDVTFNNLDENLKQMVCPIYLPQILTLNYTPQTIMNRNWTFTQMHDSSLNSYQDTLEDTHRLTYKWIGNTHTPCDLNLCQADEAVG